MEAYLEPFFQAIRIAFKKQPDVSRVQAELALYVKLQCIVVLVYVK